MKKLVCDRCGLELTDRGDIELALEGEEAWEAASRARGHKARGVLPCQNYIRCGGELIQVSRRQAEQMKKKILSQEAGSD